jgi:hypothetical protein
MDKRSVAGRNGKSIVVFSLTEFYSQGAHRQMNCHEEGDERGCDSLDARFAKTCLAMRSGPAAESVRAGVEWGMGSGECGMGSGKVDVRARMVIFGGRTAAEIVLINVTMRVVRLGCLRYNAGGLLAAIVRSIGVNARRLRGSELTSG